MVKKAMGKKVVDYEKKKDEFYYGRVSIQKSTYEEDIQKFGPSYRYEARGNIGTMEDLFPVQNSPLDPAYQMFLPTFVFIPKETNFDKQFLTNIFIQEQLPAVLPKGEEGIKLANSAMQRYREPGEGWCFRVDPRVPKVKVCSQDLLTYKYGLIIACVACLSSMGMAGWVAWKRFGSRA